MDEDGEKVDEMAAEDGGVNDVGANDDDAAEDGAVNDVGENDDDDADVVEGETEAEAEDEDEMLVEDGAVNDVGSNDDDDVDVAEGETEAEAEGEGSDGVGDGDEDGDGSADDGESAVVGRWPSSGVSGGIMASCATMQLSSIGSAAHRLKPRALPTLHGEGKGERRGRVEWLLLLLIGVLLTIRINR